VVEDPYHVLRQQLEDLTNRVDEIEDRIDREIKEIIEQIKKLNIKLSELIAKIENIIRHLGRFWLKVLFAQILVALAVVEIFLRLDPFLVSVLGPYYTVGLLALVAVLGLVAWRFRRRKK
jgi:MYXO-CTERM domain-containing protein